MLEVLKDICENVKIEDIITIDANNVPSQINDSNNNNNNDNEESNKNNTNDGGNNEQNKENKAIIFKLNHATIQDLKENRNYYMSFLISSAAGYAGETGNTFICVCVCVCVVLSVFCVVCCHVFVGESTNKKKKGKCENYVK